MSGCEGVDIGGSDWELGMYVGRGMRGRICVKVASVVTLGVRM